MSSPSVGAPRILLIDSNVYFSKRVIDALQQQGFEVPVSTQAAYALTMLEWNAPSAILCATNLREMGALEMAPILRADPKTANIPLIAVGARSFLVSRHEGFQPTQMLPTPDTALSGTLSHLDLPGVIQMLGQARQTGALHINAGETDGIIFFGGGEIVHAECGTFFGDEAVTQIVRSCHSSDKGVYKFVYGAAATQRTVLRSATDLLLDAMREFDEGERDCHDQENQNPERQSENEIPAHENPEPEGTEHHSGAHSHRLFH